MSMDDVTTSEATTSWDFPPDSENDDFWVQENGFQLGNFGGKVKPSMIRWKSGKKVDPKLLLLLQFFRELYSERREFFKKIFPGVYDEFVEVFKKVGAVLTKDKDEMMRVGTMQRSLSLGSPHNSEPRLDRFKVRTLNLGGGGVVPPGGKGGQR